MTENTKDKEEQRKVGTFSIRPGNCRLREGDTEAWPELFLPPEEELPGTGDARGGKHKGHTFPRVSCTSDTGLESRMPWAVYHAPGIQLRWRRGKASLGHVQ